MAQISIIPPASGAASCAGAGSATAEVVANEARQHVPDSATSDWGNEGEFAAISEAVVPVRVLLVDGAAQAIPQGAECGCPRTEIAEHRGWGARLVHVDLQPGPADQLPRPGKQQHRDLHVGSIAARAIRQRPPTSWR